MLELRRRRALRAMMGVLLIFGASLTYFLFFNTGLDLVSAPFDLYGKITVSNNSVHSIRDISISYVKNSQVIEIEKIPQLDPGEYKDISLSPSFVDQGKFTLQVSAPFHLGRQLVVDARSVDPSTANISFSFQYPTIGFVGQSVNAIVQACNNEPYPILTTLSLLFEEDFFEGASPSVPLNVPPFGCTSSTVSFIPSFSNSTLSFKIQISTPSGILVEKVHTMEIRPNPDSNNMAENPIIPTGGI